MIWVKRRAVTLLELLIGMVLLAMLLTILFQTYRQQQMAQIELRAVREGVEVKNFVDERLCQLFLSIDNRLALLQEKELLPTLIFTFNAGLALDENFSGDLKGILGPSDEGDLYLLTLPQKKGEVTRKELLIENVTKIEYAFFSIQEKKWRATWPDKREELPAFCGVKVWKKGSEQPYFDRIYTLPKAHVPIIYPERV